jgi:hypothetical protein
MSKREQQPKQTFQPTDEQAERIDRKLEDAEQRRELERAAEGIAAQTPHDTTIDQLEHVLALGGLSPDRARLIVRAFIDKEREVQIPRYESGAIQPMEESRIVGEHLREAVDRLLAGGASLHTVRLHADGLSSYVHGLEEAAKKRKRAEEEAARKTAEAAQQAAQREASRDQLAIFASDVVRAMDDDEADEDGDSGV